MSTITKFQFEEMQRRLARNAGLRPGSESDEPPKEKQLHLDIIAWCDSQFPRWKYIHSRMDKRSHVQIGAPDFVIAIPNGQTIYIEAKRPGEKVSPAQRDWIAEMARLKHTVHVVHTLAEFFEVLQIEAPLLLNK